MAVAFDKSKFLAANKAVKEKGFEKLPEGVYVAQINSAEFGNSKSSGRPQLVIKWEIDKEDESCGGKNHWQCIGLDNEMGYEALNWFIMKFAADVDPEYIAANIEELVPALVGSVCRIKLTHKDDFVNLRIEAVVENTLQFESKGELDEDEPIQDNGKPDPVEVENSRGEMVAVKEGMRVIVHTPKGQRFATVQKFLPEHNQILVMHDDKTPGVYPAEKCETEVVDPDMEEVEEIEEIEETTIKLEKGMTVTGMYKNEKIQGKVHDILDGIVKILRGKQVYPCKAETVTAEVPF